MKGGHGFLTRCSLYLVASLLLISTAADKARGEEEETGFTPIPIIKGMKLLPEGSLAPNFKVKDINGNEFDFAEHAQSRPHVIVFWSIFCEPCRDEMPIIEQIYNEFKGKNLGVLAVNLDGGPFLEGIKGYVKQYGYTFTVLLDELDGDTFRISDPYQVAGTPVLYIIDGRGKVYSGHLGRITAKDLRVLVAKMLVKG
jgi:thiol-disulfide isomerase/thioredoxin